MKNSQELIYLISDGTAYKIGKSHEKGLKKRLASIQTGNPRNIRVLATYFTDNSAELEKHLHRKFNDYHLRGEWFTFNENGLREFIKYMKSVSSCLNEIVPPTKDKCNIDHFEQEWEVAYKALIQFQEQNSYKPWWIYHRLKDLGAPYFIWIKFAKLTYNSNQWALNEYRNQLKVEYPPKNQKRLVKFTPVSQELLKERRLRNERYDKNKKANRLKPKAV